MKNKILRLTESQFQSLLADMIEEAVYNTLKEEQGLPFDLSANNVYNNNQTQISNDGSQAKQNTFASNLKNLARGVGKYFKNWHKSTKNGGLYGVRSGGYYNSNRWIDDMSDEQRESMNRYLAQQYRMNGYRGQPYQFNLRNNNKR